MFKCLKKFREFLQLIIQIDVIVAIGGFSALLLDPIRNEYIFKEVAGNRNITNSNISCEESNISAPGGSFNADVSKWTLYMDLGLFIPSSIAGILLTSWSDKVGRKWTMAIPLLSMIASSTVFSLAVHLKWPLKWLIFVTISGGIGGYYMVLLMQGVAYLSDITTAESRGFRFLILETCLGIAAGAGGVVSGFWVKASGFFVPVASTIGINIFNLLLVGILPNSDDIRRKLKTCPVINNNQSTMGGSDKYNEKSPLLSKSSAKTSCSDIQHSKYTIGDLIKSVYSVYTSEYSHCQICFGDLEDKSTNYNNDTCPHRGGNRPGRRWRLWVYLISYNLFMFVNAGTMVFQTIYFLSPPLCFTQVLVGIQMGVKYCGLAISPFFALFYQRVLKMTNNTIILTGLAAMATSCVIIGIATKVLLVFIGTVIFTLSITAKPFIQAQMSSLVSEFEQGSVFALVSFTEALTFLASSAAFLGLYPIFLSVNHGSCWFFGGGISVINMTLITIVYIADRRRSNQSLVEMEKES